MQRERVSWTVRWAYALPAFALAVVGIPVYVYLPKFYTDVVGVSVGAVGAILLAARLFDAVTDPAIGGLSDRTRTPMGRRRPYLVIASVPLALTLYLLFHPPAMVPSSATVWLAAAIFALFLFWTLVAVPYESLGPEITFDYDERTSLLGMRDGFLMAGTLAAAASPAILSAVLDLPADPGGERRKFLWMAWLYAPLLVVTCWVCALGVRERVFQPSPRPGGVWRDFRYLRANRPFVILLVSYALSGFGSNLPATLILYYVEYVLQSQKADLFLLIYFTTGIAFLPLWVVVARRVGKKRAWLASMAVNTGAFAGVFFLGAGDEGLYTLLVFLSGTGFGATLALPSAMQADVIDYHELLSGERREGQYIGVWSVARKLSAALGVGVALSLLGTSGYAPNVEQTPQVVFTLRVLYALAPCACNVAAFAVALAYPLNAAAHRAIRDGVALRREGRSVADPLRPERVIGG